MYSVRIGASLVLMLLSGLVVATSARAIELTPNNTAVSATVPTPTFSYEGTTFVCDSGTAQGTTGIASPSIDVALTFNATCSIAGTISVSVTCTGTATFTATAVDTGDAGSGTGTLDFDAGFGCKITTAICTIDFGPQDPATAIDPFTNTTDILNVNFDVDATRTGSALCGPAAGTLSLTGNYKVSPTGLMIN